MSEDRARVAEIVKYINLDNGQREGFIAEIVSWETHTRPAAGEYPQAVINKQFPEDIDIFVGLMGSYFGRPTKHWGSGTEEEFRVAYKKWESEQKPEIMFYFSDAMSSLSQVDPDQIKKRNAFREELGKLGVYYFTYTNITEFQFDLHNHISSAIHDVLKTKEIGKSAEAIPNESATTLRNFEGLLAQDALVSAIQLLSEGSDQLSLYTTHMNAHTTDLVKLAKALRRQGQNIARAIKNENTKEFEKSIGRVYDEMQSYSKRLSVRIPKLSQTFSNSFIAILRAIGLVKDNNLSEVLPLGSMYSSIEFAHKSLKELVEEIKNAEEKITQGPDDIIDLSVQKRIMIALHQDLVESLTKSIELLDRLMQESFSIKENNAHGM